MVMVQSLTRTSPPLPVGGSKRRAATNTNSNSDGGSDIDAEAEDDDDLGELSDKETAKIEVRREKNRVKQRNLRQRRANHITTLEKSVTTLRAEISTLKGQLTSQGLASAQTETRLQGHIRDLEDVLNRHGLAGKLHAIQQRWGNTSNPNPNSTGGTWDTGTGRASGSSSIPDGNASASAPAPLSWAQSFSASVEADQRSRSSSSSNSNANSNANANANVNMIGNSAVAVNDWGAYPWSTFQTQSQDTASASASGEYSNYQAQAQAQAQAQSQSRELELVPSPRGAVDSRHDQSGPLWDFIRASGSMPEQMVPISTAATHNNNNNNNAMTNVGLWQQQNNFFDMSSAFNLGGAAGGGTDGGDSASTSVSAIVTPPTPTAMSNYLDYLLTHQTFFPDLPLATPYLHPSIHTARSLLLTLLPNPLPSPLPDLPTLTAAQQQIILLALSHLSPPHISDAFRARQLAQLPDADAKVLLEYQSSPHTDSRLVMFPIAVMRSRIVRALKNNLPFDLTLFINSTLSSARVYGVPLDTDAWDLPDTYWDIWEGWFARGKEYCHSLDHHRKRDAHSGSSVVEMILGVEKLNSRRNDAVGKPDGWKFFKYFRGSGVIPAFGLNPEPEPEGQRSEGGGGG